MTRPRRPEDWDRDLAERHGPEQAFLAALRATDGITAVTDRRDAFDAPDFWAVIHSRRVGVELKTKRQRYSRQTAAKAPEVAYRDLFMIDDKAWRETIEQRCLLVVWDEPGDRWVCFTPDTLVRSSSEVLPGRTLDRRRRMVKPKRMVDLSGGACAGRTFADAAATVADTATV